MRIAVAVVVGLVLLGVGQHTVRADEAPPRRSEICVDGCNFLYEKCQANAGPKGSIQCTGDVVRCKNECPYEPPDDPAVPTEKGHRHCINQCRDVYKSCKNAAASVRGISCSVDDMHCEKACPKPEPEPEVAVAPPPQPAPKPGHAAVVAPESVPVQAAPLAPPAPVAPAPEVKSLIRGAARGEGTAAPVPVPAVATPATSVGERAGMTATTVRSEAVTAPPEVSTEASAAARPAQSERGFFDKIVCFFTLCEPAGSIPCLQECGTTYDQCHEREARTATRAGECSTSLMHCRQACRDDASAVH